MTQERSGSASARRDGTTSRRRHVWKSHSRSWSLVAASVLIFMFVGCGDDESTAPENAPPGHTVVEDGVAHAPGLESPLQNCTNCHGANLEGGTNGQPSCFTCHGQVWP